MLRSRHRGRPSFPLVLLFIALAIAARAEPAVQWQASTQATLDGTARSGPGLTLRARLEAAIDLGNGWSAAGTARLLPQGNPTGRFLARESLLAEEAFLRWEGEGFRLRLGKFTPNFARAWWLAPGLYGDSFAGDAEILEQLGIEAGWSTATAWGRHGLTLAVTMADRSPLGQTLITDRGRLRLRDGGPSNTDLPRSWTAAYDARDLPVADARLDLHAGLSRLARGHGNAADEDLAVLAASGSRPLGDATLTALAEWVRRQNPDGARGRTDIVTIGADWTRGDWSANLVAGSRDRHPAGAPARHERLLTATIVRRLDETWSLAAGWRTMGGVTTVGLELAARFGPGGPLLAWH